MPNKITRREFLMGCSAAIAHMSGARLTQVAFGDPANNRAPDHEIMVVVFLRGAWDALNVVPPIGGDDRGYYEANRAELQVPVNEMLQLNDLFGFHPSMAPLHDLYQDQKLAVVHATGLTTNTRSHFDAMQYMELGTPGVKTTSDGWITRHLETAPNLPTSILIPAMSAGTLQATSLLSSSDAIAMNDPDGFSYNAHWSVRDMHRMALRRMYNGNTWLYQAGTRTLNIIDIIEAASPGSYAPSNGADYSGTGSFGNNLQVIAQMIKLDLGMRVATIDLGGWDTHENQGDGSGGYMSGMLDDLARGLAAFYQDLDGVGEQNYTSRLSVVVMSEFGRRLRENASGGTDHGRGSVMLALGGNVNGGQVFGNWPGLGPDQLFERTDLEVTTDYRRVLSEMLIRRGANPNLNNVFPGYSGYSPIGVFRGTDLTPVQDEYKVYLPQIIR